MFFWLVATATSRSGSRRSASAMIKPSRLENGNSNALIETQRGCFSGAWRDAAHSWTRGLDEDECGYDTSKSWSQLSYGKGIFFASNNCIRLGRQDKSNGVAPGRRGW